MEPIKIWRFEEAPEHMQALSDNGGDEDWLALIPPGYGDHDMSWLEQPAFGCCDVSDYDHPSWPSWTVRIGSHG